MRYLRVRGWPKFQHYRDRRPVWIKLYVELHAKWEWMSLPDHTKAHLSGLWLLVAQIGNRLPWDPQFLSQKIGATVPITHEELELLVARTFLEPDEAAGARVPAEPERHASRTGAEPSGFAIPPHTPPIDSRDQRTETPPNPPAAVAPRPLDRTAARMATDRLVAARQAAGHLVPREARRAIYEQLLAGVTEEQLLAQWEAHREAQRAAAAAEAATTAEDTAASREAETWIQRRGGGAVVARSVLEWAARKGLATTTAAAVVDAWRRDDQAVPRLVPMLLLGAVERERVQARAHGPPAATGRAP